MAVRKVFNSLLLSFLLLTFLTSCNKGFKGDDYTAYFGGEVSNPTSKYIFFSNNSKVVDSVKLDKNNRFFIKFDSLTPGMYTFRNDPEYQYVYFDKNDSIMVQINARDFDNSVVFCGRGDQKNNFLMELYLKNEEDRSKAFDIFDYGVPKFIRSIDSSYQSKRRFYNHKKEDINWNNGFDRYAKAALELPHYSKKEIYPVVHKLRTGTDISKLLPKGYYDFRKNVDYNNTALSNYSPFINYVTHMLNNVSAINYHNNFSDVDVALKTNINKLNIADTLIKNEKVRNVVLNNIAFTYLLEDQNMANNASFLETYHKYSTDNSSKNEILKIGNAIQSLKPGNALPKVALSDVNGKTISSEQIAKNKTVIFFWTENLASHMVAAHKKILALKLKYPEYNFVAINLDTDQAKWADMLSKYKFDGITELRSANFDDLKDKWAITKVHRTIVLDGNGAIKNAFTNLFELNFENELDGNSIVRR